jgi:uncharacterized protein DUF6205
MGYRTAAYGTIAITPPIPWGKIKDSPFRPNELGGSLDLDIHLMVVESVRETDEGTLTAREATGVEQRYEDDPRNYQIQEHLQQLIDAFPEHTFTGRLDMIGEDSGDMWRLKVVDRRAVRFDPHIVWPGASE